MTSRLRQSFYKPDEAAANDASLGSPLEEPSVLYPTHPRKERTQESACSEPRALPPILVVVVQSLRPTLCDRMDCRPPGFPGFCHLQSLLKLMSSDPVMPPNHLVLCRPFLSLPSVFLSIRVFPND